MVQAIGAFLEVCYIARQAIISEEDLDKLESEVARFHDLRVAFADVRGDGPDAFSLPRQHSLVHYAHQIRQYGAPTGLCSSITESKHIDAVKKPYRRSNRYEALGQMLLTNQRIDKLKAARTDFTKQGMMKPLVGYGTVGQVPEDMARTFEDSDSDSGSDSDSTSSESDSDSDDDVNLGEVRLAKRHSASSSVVLFCPFLIIDSVRGYPSAVEDIAARIGVPHFGWLISKFLQIQMVPGLDPDTVPEEDWPTLRPKAHIRCFPAAVAWFSSPIDALKSKKPGVLKEYIRAVESWRGGHPRFDTVFVVNDDEKDGFEGLWVARVRLFFSFLHAKHRYPCALVTEFSTFGNAPDPVTGMWRITPDPGPRYSVIHVKSILRAAHLMGCGTRNTFLPNDFQHYQTLDSFQSFYVNKYVDHHSHEIAF